MGTDPEALAKVRSFTRWWCPEIRGHLHCSGWISLTVNKKFSDGESPSLRSLRSLWSMNAGRNRRDRKERKGSFRRRLTKQLRAANPWSIFCPIPGFWGKPSAGARTWFDGETRLLLGGLRLCLRIATGSFFMTGKKPAQPSNQAWIRRENSHFRPNFR
ncbi:MAG TPA: hypothetical protein VGO11_19945 [Chthoniobacteraceae bacterium]|jgi:hypothetical protein|nr:hypothetical protein [Chthoniobacteraceae bacterium]